jgi:hypothetical protein
MTGTWVELNCGKIWVFNSDGTGKCGNVDFKYASSNDNVIIYLGTREYGDAYDYIKMGGGNTVMLLPIGNTGGHVLTKRN